MWVAIAVGGTVAVAILVVVGYAIDAAMDVLEWKEDASDE